MKRHQQKRRRIMQHIQDSAAVEKFLCDMATSLEKGAFCWEDWLMLRIDAEHPGEHALDAHAQRCVVETVRSFLAGMEGAVLATAQGAVLVLVTSADESHLEGLLRALNQSTDILVPLLAVEAFHIGNDRELLRLALGEHVEQREESSREALGDRDIFQQLAPHLGDFIEAWVCLNEARDGRSTPHLLVVDDDPITRRIVRQALAERYPVITADSAAQAVEKHLLLAPDIVFLDIGLPDCDGFRILQHIHESDPQCRVIMFSGNSFLDNRLKALALGASGFLPKPFNRKQFESCIGAWRREHETAS
jgi:CheY-like chemotaxis protein